MDKSVLYDMLSGKKPLGKDTLEPLKALTERFPYFQMGWMLYLKNLKEVGSRSLDETLKEVAVRVPDRHSLHLFLQGNLQAESFDFESALGKGYLLDKDMEPSSGNSLIDRFLDKGAVKIEVQEGELEQKSKEYLKRIVDQSVEENDEIVTEALAMIYVQQKNYKKAQLAYQKLSLKYPEKSVYFASRIKEIENLKNL